MTGPKPETDDRLKNLSPAQAALLHQRLLERRAARAASDVIPARVRTGPTPLSHAQELLWLLDQLTPGGIAYNSPDAMRLRGSLKVGALMRALHRLVERHEILRTVYRTVNGEPVQIVLSAEPFPLEVVDLTGKASIAQEHELQGLLKHHSELPFDLATGPVMRALLVRLSDDDNVLLTVVHHIATDGWSKGVTWRELGQLYVIESKHGVDPLLQPPIQYADYALWQRERLSGAQLESELAYWREKLRRAPALLELPTDRPRPAVQTYAGAHQNLLVERPVLDGLNQLARDEGATLFMVLLAAFKTLVSRHSRQDDVVVGAPIAGRNRPEIEGMIGYFMNTLALRTSLEGDPTFRELLRRVKETTLDAFEHQEVPFEKVVIEIRPERDLSFSPVFQVMMVLQNHKREVSRFADLEIESVGHERAWSKFDLTLGMGERPTGLNTSWEYSTDLFDDETIARMSGHFAALLAGIAADADRPLSALPMVSEAERSSLLELGSGPDVELPADATLHGLFSARARCSPERTAVVEGARSLTYRALDERSSQLARHLASVADVRGAPVGVFLDRSLDLAVSLLAVLKSGAMCMPLDPAYPRARVEAMLADARCPVVITTEALRSALPAVAARIVVIDLDGAVIARLPADDPEERVDPGAAAYLLYTSGSTGVPKGVELAHRGLVNHSLAMSEILDLRPSDRILQFASISFDLSIEELFPAWNRGATVVMRPPDLPIAGPEFLTYLSDHQITVLDLPTAFWHEWVNDLDVMRAQVPTSVRAVVVGGEKVSAAVHACWLRLGGDRVRWFNTYGPTEASVVVTSHEAQPIPVDDVPLGRPLPNTRLLVLDEHRQLVPVGVPGELYIGGVSVAIGYRGQPEQTSDRFVDDPFPPLRAGAGEPGRLYRTGDVVRWRADGSIEYIGRADNQLKIRGFRIEPGEIESALCTHDAVSEALVVAASDRNGSKRLVAYLVCGERVRPTTAELRPYLTERLPGYMVPSAYVALDAFPKTPNGKIDREALPAPEAALVETAGTVAARNPVEVRLCDLWARLLVLDGPPGVLDDFFELGGHSLLAVRMFAEIHEEFGVRLPLTTIFRGATIEDLARHLTVESPSPVWDALVVLNQGDPRLPPLILTPWVSGEVLGFRTLVALLDPRITVVGVQAIGLDGSQRPHTRIEEMAEHYVEEIVRAFPQGRFFLGGFCFGGWVALEMARRLQERGREVLEVFLFDTDRTEERRTLIQHERHNWRRFLNLHTRAKVTFIAQRVRNLGLKIEWTLWFKLFDLWSRTRLRLPRYLLNIRRLNARALEKYDTPPASCTVTLFKRNDTTEAAEFDRKIVRAKLAIVSLRICSISDMSSTHVEVMMEPVVSVLADQLQRRIDEVLLKSGTSFVGAGRQEINDVPGEDT